MNKRTLLAFILVLVVALGLWTLFRKKLEASKPPTPVAEPQPPQLPPHPAAPSILDTQSLVTVDRSPSNTVMIEGVPVSKDYLLYADHVRQDPLYDWKQPINFYGKVVDESNQPIDGASVDYTWSTLSKTGTLTKHDQTDISGLFSIHEIGSGIGITASKEGYYTSPSERLKNFEYANHGEGVFTPDAANPVVFHLRKRGVGADLITSQYGVRTDFPISIPLDGTPVRVDLVQRRVAESGQVQISERKPEHGSWREATSWSFRMDIPDGGFVEETEQFPFEAPESGYQQVIEFQFQKDSTNWIEGINKSYYIKFGSPPRYGRFQVQTDLSYGGAILSYAINPDGSRNLEPK
jgi:hypothetical protein